MHSFGEGSRHEHRCCQGHGACRTVGALAAAPHAGTLIPSTRR